MITEKKYKAGIATYHLIGSEINRIGQEYIDEFHPRSYFNEIEIEDSTFRISYETSYCGCCTNDQDSVSIPINYIWDDDWIEQEKERLELLAKVKEEEKRLEKLAKEKAKRKAAKQAEKDRYAEFLQMKEEYAE